MSRAFALWNALECPRQLQLATVAAIAIVLSGCRDSDAARSGADAAATGGEPSVLRFADTGVEGMEELRRAFGPFVGIMEEILDVKVEFFPVSNRTIAATALELGQVDLVLAGPTEYLFMRSRSDVIPVVGIERERYRTVFVVPAASDAESLLDLRGKRIALKDHGSTSGHVMPMHMLRQAGLDLDRDIRVLMLGGARVEALLAGDVDALAGGMRDFDQIVRRAGPGAFRILAESPQLPRDLLVARSGLCPEFIARLRERIIANGDRLMDAMVTVAARDRYASARFVAASDAEYDLLRDAHRALGLRYE